MKINIEKFICLIRNIRNLKQYSEFEGVFYIINEIEREYADIEDIIDYTDDIGCEISNTNIISNIGGVKSYIANKKINNRE